MFAWLAGCSLVNAYPSLELVEEGGGTPGEAGATATGGEGGQGGQGGRAGQGGASHSGCTDEICAADAGECETAVCVEGIVCDVDPLPLQTPCSVGVCDGGGHCVDCVESSDCGSNEHCDRLVCVPATCSDAVQNGSETGIDCGGPVCASCPNGQGCLGPNDCVSGLCMALICTACASHIECASSEYCGSGICSPKKPAFAACDYDEMCQSGNCNQFGACA